MRDEKLHTYAEAQRALGVDAKTLREWVRREGWEGEHGEPLQDEQGQPYIATDPLDKRVKLLTRQQLQTLAKRHGCTLKDISERPPRGNATQREILARLEALEAELARLRERAGWLFAEGAPVRAPRANLTPPVSEATTEHVAPAPPRQSRKTKPLPKAIPGRVRLPPDFIPESTYLVTHSISGKGPGVLQARTLFRGVQTGEIPAPEQAPEGVEWRSDKNQPVKRGYSLEAHRQVSRYVAKNWPNQFQPCDLCRNVTEDLTLEELTLAAVAIPEDSGSDEAE